jgi:hypothetical protein
MRTRVVAGQRKLDNWYNKNEHERKKAEQQAATRRQELHHPLRDER